MTSGNGRKRRSRNGIIGSVYPRGKKWAYNVDLDLGPDPLTGERRRDARSGFPTEDAAWAAAEANSQMRVNRYVKNTPRTVRLFLDEWLVSVRISVKPTTYSNYRNYVEYYVVPIIGDRKLQDIAPETITRLYGHLLEKGRRRGNSNQLMHGYRRRAIDAGQRPKLAEMAVAGGVSYAGANRAAQRYRAGRTQGEYSAGLDARTVHSVHTMLNRAFRDAVNWRNITENPVTLATRVRQSRKAHDVWTAEQLRRFLAEARKERLYAMWLMFATTGMRRSEAAGATRALVDTDARTVALWDTRVIAGGQAIESGGKTVRSRRLLALDRRTAAAVVDHLAMLDTEDVPELHHAAAETVSGLFLDDVDDAPDEPPIDLP